MSREECLYTRTQQAIARAGAMVSMLEQVASEAACRLGDGPEKCVTINGGLLLLYTDTMNDLLEQAQTALDEYESSEYEKIAAGEVTP